MRVGVGRTGHSQYPGGVDPGWARWKGGRFREWAPPPAAAPHLPVALVGLGLELEDPVASTDFGTVGHREDDGAAKQEARGPTGHRGAQHCLGPFRKGAGDRREAVRGGPKELRRGSDVSPTPGVTEGRSPPLGPPGVSGYGEAEKRHRPSDCFRSLAITCGHSHRQIFVPVFKGSALVECL